MVSSQSMMITMQHMDTTTTLSESMTINASSSSVSTTTTTVSSECMTTTTPFVGMNTTINKHITVSYYVMPKLLYVYT